MAMRASRPDRRGRSGAALVEQVRDGRDYREIHVDAHLRLADVLQQLGLVRMTPESQLESGVSAVFFPHGIGHLIGLQVHDVAGFAASDEGGMIARPDGHPFLRLTRTLAPGMVVTIEPGLYFIELLLRELRAGARRRSGQDAVECLSQFGGCGSRTMWPAPPMPRKTSPRRLRRGLS